MTTTLQKTIQVALAIPFADSLTYLVDDAISIQNIHIGARVVVPFRNKTLVGIVVSLNNPQYLKNLKPLIKVLDAEAFIPKDMMIFMQQVHNYYLSPLGEVLFCGIPKWFKNPSNPQLPKELWWQVSKDLSKKELGQLLKSDKQLRIYHYLQENGPLQSRFMTHIEKGSASHCRALYKKGLLLQSDLCFVDAHPPKDPDFILTPDQNTALQTISQNAGFACHLLDGITGSGKTEVYIRLVKALVNANKQALILVPEIGLTPQLFHEFAKRIHGRVAVLHSGLTAVARARAWQKAKSGDIDVIVATRSGIFTPFTNLAIIIVDEEHDLSFKQQDGFRYSARDLAVMRAKMLNIPVILGSATPSLESFNNAKTGKYQWLKLRERTNKQALPGISILDVRKHKMQQGLSSQVLQQIETEINNGNQALVFLNRRGWSPKLSCQDCGWVAECDECDTYLTYHKHIHRLRCHHCERLYAIPEFCPECGSQKIETMGVGTEKIQHGLEKIKDIRVIRVDRDTVKTPIQWQQTIDEIKTGIPCVMVGTQMLSKGHDFPNLTLVVIVNVDNSFYSLDFRATEHLSQLMIQVSGRAGRKHKTGKVVIQTQCPHHEFFKLLLGKSYQDYAAHELQQRQDMGFPPASYMAIIRGRCKNEKTLNDFFEYILSATTENPTVSIMGPIPAPMYKKMGLFQMQLIFNGNNRQSLHSTLKQVIALLRNNKICNNIIWSLDLDPIVLS
ncbi:MAG TPA: primosomal protein N' [Oceanospirillales bacterium]|nr:primosomal protein N' [Oceanospirillales bacterium]